MSDHPDLEKLDASVRNIVREVFRDPANGTPDNISKAGCLALAKQGSEAWNAWRECWPVIAQMGNTKFRNNADFSQHAFFREDIHFAGFRFGKGANFQSTNFMYEQYFQRCVFEEGTSFKDSKFSSKVYLNNATFSGNIYFENTDFGYFARFNESVFNGSVMFNGAIFKSAWFRKTLFNDRVGLNNAKFIGATDFGIDDQSGAQFKFTPLFQGVEINQSFNIRFAKFPDAHNEPNNAESYRTLKLAFSKLQAIREEQRFFKLEMAEEASRASGFERYLFGRYKAFSNYGLSVSKPLRMLFETLIAFGFLYGILSWVNCKPDYCHFSAAWIEFTLVQALPLPGLDKLSESLRDALYPRQGGWNVFVTTAVILHKATSLLALFLIGLGLRNLFKLK